MKIAIIGAGPVGQVLGAYFQRSGAQLDLWVRRPSAQPLAFEVVRYQPTASGRPAGSQRPRTADAVGPGHEPQPVELSFAPESVFELRAGPGRFDDLGDTGHRGATRYSLAVLALPASALDDPSWVTDLAQLADVCLVVQPGLALRERLVAGLGASRVLEGLFAMLALAGGFERPNSAGASALESRGDTEPAPSLAANQTGLFVPPGGGLTLDRNHPAALAIARRLASSGLPVRLAADLRGDLLLGSALLDVLVGALDAVDYRFEALGRPSDRRLLASAICEALSVTAAQRGLGRGGRLALGTLAPTLARWVGASSLLPLLGFVAERFAPIGLRHYVEHHYRKLRPQTLASLREWCDLAATTGMPHRALRALLQRGGKGTAHDAEPALGELRSLAAPTLASRRVCPTSMRGMAIKRNQHLFHVPYPVADVADALERTLREPGASHAGLEIRRLPGLAGEPFRVGERICGTFGLRHLLVAIAPRLALALFDGAERRSSALDLVEELALSDVAEIVAIELSSATPSFRYRYLEPSPIAGESCYRLEPDGAGTRVRVTFTFQERGWGALFLMQLFGVAAHDRVVAAQMRAVAERLESAARGSDSQFPKLLADAAHFL